MPAPDLTQPILPATSATTSNATGRGGNPLFNPDGTIRSPQGKTSKGYRSIYQTGQGVSDILPALMLALQKTQQGGAVGQAQSELDLLKSLGPQFADINTLLNRQGQQGQASTDAELLNTTGKDVTSATLDNMKLADPEFFNLRQTLGQGAEKLLGGMNPNELSEAEIANIERTNNRNNIAQGTAGSGGNLAAIKSAMTFGDKLQQKQSSFANTLTSIGNLAPQLKSGAFNYAASTGQAGAGSAQDNVGGSFAATQQQGANLASNLLGQGGSLVGNERNIQANKIPGWERTVSALPDYS